MRARKTTLQGRNGMIAASTSIGVTPKPKGREFEKISHEDKGPGLIGMITGSKSLRKEVEQAKGEIEYSDKRIDGEEAEGALDKLERMLYRDFEFESRTTELDGRANGLITAMQANWPRDAVWSERIFQVGCVDLPNEALFAINPLNSDADGERLPNLETILSDPGRISGLKTPRGSDVLFVEEQVQVDIALARVLRKNDVDAYVALEEETGTTLVAALTPDNVRSLVTFSIAGFDGPSRRLAATGPRDQVIDAVAAVESCIVQGAHPDVKEISILSGQGEEAIEYAILARINALKVVLSLAEDIDAWKQKVGTGTPSAQFTLDDLSERTDMLLQRIARALDESDVRWQSCPLAEGAVTDMFRLTTDVMVEARVFENMVDGKNFAETIMTRMTGVIVSFNGSAKELAQRVNEQVHELSASFDAEVLRQSVVQDIEAGAKAMWEKGPF